MLELSESTTVGKAVVRRLFLSVATAVGLFIGLHASAQSELPGAAASVQLFAKGPHSRVALRLPEIFHETKTDAINVEFQIDKDWHIYWENPGDSGEEPKFDFSGSEGLTFGKPMFPIPKRIAAGPFTNFGFDSALGRPVVIRIPVKVLPGGSQGFASVVLDLSYLVCKEECIPAEVKLRGRVPVRATENQAAIEVAYRVEEFPPLRGVGSRQDPLLSDWTVDRSGKLVFQLKNFNYSGDLTKLEFFPLASFSAKHGSRGDFTRLSSAGGETLQVALELDPSLSAPAPGASLEGLVVDGENGTAVWVRLVSTASLEWLGLLRYLAFAFLGGLILNLMPCVFPVVSLKVLSFVKESRGDRRETLIHAVLYALGVLISLWVLLAVLLALRSAGTAVGWGFQLQNPIFLYALYGVFLLLGFNLLGLFEINYAGPGSLQNLMMTRGRVGSFFTGLLTTVVATPCSAPFMGVAIGAALASGNLESALVFTVLGLGLASPYILLGLFPKLVEKLPRPGAWMDRFKQLLAFPLFLTAVWLLWILSQSGSTASLVMIMAWSVVVGFFIWARHHQLTWIKWIGLGAVLAGFILIATVLEGSGDSEANSSQLGTRSQAWESYNESKIQDALAQGKSVFIDYTASWCVTCQVNKKLVLDTERGQSLFKAADVRLFRADWTRRDPEISNSLSRLGRQSVPVYAFYKNGSTEPVLLPEILTFEILESSVNGNNYRD